MAVIFYLGPAFTPTDHRAYRDKKDLNKFMASIWTVRGSSWKKKSLMLFLLGLS
jgi:hypothetical protein